MARIVQLVVILVLVYFAVTVGWPWLHRHLDRLGADGATAAAGASPAAHCVDLASRANDTFGRGITRFANPPYDSADWMRFGGEVQNRMREAEAACVCADDACRDAGQAMSELGNLVQQMDGMVRGSADTVVNPAFTQERIDDLLNQARSELR